MQNVKQFISIIENYPIDGLTRGEHETCVLAANLLRRCLKMGLCEDVWVGVEIKDKHTRKAMDLVLVGESSKSPNKTSLRILEFKQWSKVNLKTDNLDPNIAYEAVAWGKKPLYHEYQKDEDLTATPKRYRCPLFQLQSYHSSMMNQKWENSDAPEIVSSLVFPNMVDDAWANILRQKISSVPMFSGEEIFTLENLGNLAESIAEQFSNGPSLTRDKVLDFYSKGKIAQTENDFIETPPIELYSKKDPNQDSKKQRHGWIGGVDQFIRSCENNDFARDFIDDYRPAERRAIIFSCNHLATELRKLWNEGLNQKSATLQLVKHLCIVVEFHQIFGERRIDIVFAAKGKDKQDISLFLVEMKAWSLKTTEKNVENDSIESIEFKVHDDLYLAGRKLPSKYSYPVQGERRKVSHPIQQVQEYIHVLESEYDPPYIGGCAWLHNLHGKLSGAMLNLHISHHIMMDKNSITIFERPGFESLPLLTRDWSYSWDRTRIREQKDLIETLKVYFEPLQPVKFDADSLHRLCNLEPELSSFSVQKAYMNSSFIFGDDKSGKKPLLDEEQIKIAKTIIDEVVKTLKDSKNQKIITIKGDAGTGKTLIAIAAIGEILNYLKKEKIDINKNNYPALICANNPAAKTIIRGCMTSTESDRDGKYIGSNFIKDRTDFNSLNEFFLAHKLHGCFEVEKNHKDRLKSLPCVLMFDESQLFSHYTDGGNAPALRDHLLKQNGKIVKKDGKNEFIDPEFEKWLDEKGFRFPNGMKSDLKCDIEVLSSLSPVTVIFLDERQATRASAIGNICLEKIQKYSKDNGIKLIEMELKKSYRNETAYTQMIKKFLYNSNEDFPIENNRTFTVNVSENEDEFLKSFGERTESNTDFSCGLVAGYTQEHISNDDPTKHDWEIGGREFQWNLAPGTDWIFSNESRKERIGYFLAVQGNELDEIFVYIGKDLVFDSVKKRVVPNLTNHRSESDCIKNAKNNASIRVTDEQKEMCIVNQYWVLLTRAKKKITIYCEDESLRNYLIDLKNEFGY